MSRMSLISDSDASQGKEPPSGNSDDPSSKADATNTSAAMEDSTPHETHAGDNNVTDSDKTTSSFPAEISVAKAEETVPKQPRNPTPPLESTATPPETAPHLETTIAKQSTSAVEFDSEFDDVTLTMPREKTYAPKKILCITVTSGSKFVCMVMATVVIFFFILLLALVLSVSSYHEPETTSLNATLNISSVYTTETPDNVTTLLFD